MGNNEIELTLPGRQNYVGRSPVRSVQNYILTYPRCKKKEPLIQLHVHCLQTDLSVGGSAPHAKDVNHYTVQFYIIYLFSIFFLCKTHVTRKQDLLVNRHLRYAENSSEICPEHLVFHIWQLGSH